jgi:GNAT superfamily N-acetyltransferase
MNIQITIADPFTTESRLLIERFWDELCEIYGDSGPCQFQPEEIHGEGAQFIIARAGKEPVGCGAFRPLEPGVAEIKRIFVERKARRQGIARRILHTLETMADAHGYALARLETGTPQREAVALYESCGYRRCANFGPYRDDPLSVCYEKPLLHSLPEPYRAFADRAMLRARERLNNTEYAFRSMAFVKDACEKANEIEISAGVLPHEAAREYEADRNRESEPPPGAFVFYDCEERSNGERENRGHVGLCVGRGYVIHAWDCVRLDHYRDIPNLAAPADRSSPIYYGWASFERILRGYRTR